MNRHLCYDIVYNILTRLPTTSIIRFIIVCKQWRDILTNPTFWENHRLCNPDPKFLFTFSQNKIINLSVNMPNCPEILCRADHADYYFGGTSNGLILLAPIHSSNSSSIIIINPITRRHVTISLSTKFRMIAGFGYSRLSKQYKILMINNYFNSSNVYASNIRVWTFGSAEPPRVVMEDLNCNIGESLYINGSIYARLIEPSESLFAFDVEKETCKFIEFSFAQSCSYLMEVGGSLCVASVEKDDIFLWFLGDNGWTVRYVLKSSAENEGVSGVWELKSELLVWFTNRKFFLYYRKLGQMIIDKGENTNLVDLQKSHKLFVVDKSKFFDLNWRLCWGFEPTLESPKMLENLEASYGTSSSGTRIAYEQENLCGL